MKYVAWAVFGVVVIGVIASLKDVYDAEQLIKQTNERMRKDAEEHAKWQARHRNSVQDLADSFAEINRLGEWFKQYSNS